MRNFTISLPVQAVRSEELPETDRALVEEAWKATSRAYAPYSHFSVGAAVRLASGKVFSGSNQENAAFPSGTCAERTTAFYAHSSCPDDPFEAIAIAALDTDGKPLAEPISPCGACRQALVEFEKLAGHPVKVLLAGRDETYILPSVASILPLTFTEF